MHTGSLVNLVTGAARTVPEVGMGATILGWTDRHAATVVEVKGASKVWAVDNVGIPTTVVVQLDHARRTDQNGVSESQTYEYTPNPNGHRETYTLRRNGAYVRQGESMKGGGRVAIGARNTYHDFSF